MDVFSWIRAGTKLDSINRYLGLTVCQAKRAEYFHLYYLGEYLGKDWGTSLIKPKYLAKSVVKVQLGDGSLLNKGWPSFQQEVL